MIIDDLEYVSAPLGVDRVLSKNSPARRKFKQFQNELTKQSKKNRGELETGTSDTERANPMSKGVKQQWTKNTARTAKTKSGAEVQEKIGKNGDPILVSSGTVINKDIRKNLSVN